MNATGDGILMNKSVLEIAIREYKKSQKEVQILTKNLEAYETFRIWEKFIISLGGTVPEEAEEQTTEAKHD